MRIADLALVVAAVIALVMAVEGSHVDLGHHEVTETRVAAPEVAMITCPLRKPEFATVMQAAFLGDGTLLVEQQTNTRVRHIKDC